MVASILVSAAGRRDHPYAGLGLFIVLAAMGLGLGIGQPLTISWLIEQTPPRQGASPCPFGQAGTESGNSVCRRSWDCSRQASVPPAS